MAYAEKRGNLWRARWRAPDGTLESKPGFMSRKDAENYGHDQEAAIRNNTYSDPRAGRITVTEWVNQWFPALDLELTTLSNYRYMIEVHILSEFGDRRPRFADPRGNRHGKGGLLRKGTRSVPSKDARSVLVTLLGDAIPRHIQSQSGTAPKRARAGRDYDASSGTREPRRHGRRRFKRCL